MIRVRPELLMRDKRGAISVAFGMILLVILAMVGGSVDYSRAGYERTVLQSSLDAAILSGTRAMIEGEQSLDRIKSIVNSAFKVNYESTSNTKREALVYEFNIDVDNVVIKASAKVDVETTILSLVGIDSIAIGVDSEVIAGKPQGFALDTVFCIDTTGSMANTIESVKRNAMGFAENLNNKMEERNLPSFAMVRARLIEFKDLDADGMDSMKESRFFDMQTEDGRFKETASQFRASGGGDWPESGLDCTLKAVQSEWTKVGAKIPGGKSSVTDAYPLVVVWSDAATLPLKTSTPRSIKDLWDDEGIVPQENQMIVHFGVCRTAGEMGSQSWNEIKALDGYSCGGSVTDGNQRLVDLLVDAIAKRMKNRTIRIAN